MVDDVVSSARFHRSSQSITCFNFVEMEPLLGRRNVSKVMRWVLLSSALTYRSEHVLGNVNAWPDTLIKLMRGFQRALTIRRIAIVLPLSGVVKYSQMTAFYWPFESQVQEIQSKSTRPANAKKRKNSFF